MSGVLVVMERKGDGAWHRMSFEALAAGQKLANELGVACSAAVLGESAAIAPLAAELATKKLESVWAVGDSLLAEYTADGWVAALQQLIAETKPKFVVLPHTYQVRDFAPALATRLGEVLIGDVTAIEVADAQSGVTFLRQWMQGKLNAEYRHRSEGGVCFVSVQAGSFRADAVKAGDGRGEDVCAEAGCGEDSDQAGRAVSRGGADGGSVDCSGDCECGPRDWGAGQSEAGGGAGERAGSGAGGVAADLRCGLAADGAAGGELGADGGAEAVPGGGDLRCDPAPGGDEGREDGGSDQQGCGRADL